MRTTVVALFIVLGSVSFAQNIQVQNMINYLRSKEYDKAKASADAAAIHESTIKSAKMWMYRGNVYRAIYSDTSVRVRSIDAEAEEKALDAYINCLKNDKDNIYKDEMKGYLVMAAGATSNKAKTYIYNKDYDKALKCFDLLEQSIPYDFDGGIKRNNITKDKLMYSKFEMYKNSGDKAKTMEAANKLISIQYREPRLYTDMVRICMLDKDTVSALGYIEKGKVLFEDNMELITAELDIYIARNKTNELKDRLTKALELTPDNEVLHLVLANLYQKTNQKDMAEKEYLEAIRIRPDYEPANYNLGVLYYNKGKDWNDKLNALSPKDPKNKEYENNVNESFKKAVVYFEASYEATKDKRTKQTLRQLYLRLGDTEKAEKYK
jgi:tetratricopeptide (TPR) repeat protein